MLIEFNKRIEEKVRNEWKEFTKAKEKVCEILEWWSNKCFMLDEIKNALYLKGAVNIIENAYSRIENELTD